MRDSFVEKMREFCDKAIAEGKMNRIQKFRVLAACVLPRKRKLFETELASELQLDAEMAAQGLIDWDNIDVDKLIQIIEAIMMLIEFISKLS